MAKANKIIKKNALNFLERYINNPSPTGFEKEGQKLWMEYMAPYVDAFITDPYGTAVGVINPDASYKLAIEAHADEISWFVNYISPEGFIYVVRNGGSDHQIAPSKRVNIHTKKGIVKAIFGWPAIHTRRGSNKEESPKDTNIFLDCGCNSREEVEKLGIHPGCVITYEDEFMILNDQYFVGRALDNRIGGFMIAEVARMIRENQDKLDIGLYIVNSVQEEVGLRGAEMIAERIKPDAVIVTDVCHDTQTPMIKKNVEGDLAMNKGPVLTVGPAVHNHWVNYLESVAKENDIPFQWSAASRSTGTDTDAFAYAAGGIPSVLISLPMRYMHTTVESVSKADTENTIRWMYEAIRSFNPETVHFDYFAESDN